MENGKIDYKRFVYLSLGLGLVIILLLVLKFAFPSEIVDMPSFESYLKPASINWTLLRRPISVVAPSLQISLTSIPETAASGTPVSLEAEVMGISQGPFIYHFDCNGDGIFELESEAVLQKKYTAQNLCFFNKKGLFSPEVIVDGIFDYYQDGQEIKENKTVRISSVVEIVDSNLPPVFSVCDVSSIEGTTQVNFKFNFSSQATDPNGDEVKYEWDFGDGNTAQGQNVEYGYKTTGLFIPRVKAFDANGAFSYCIAKSLTILNGLSSFENVSTPWKLGRANPFSPVTSEELVVNNIEREKADKSGQTIPVFVPQTFPVSPTSTVPVSTSTQPVSGAQ